MTPLGLPMKKSRLQVVTDNGSVTNKYIIREWIDGARLVHTYTRIGAKNFTLHEDMKERKYQACVTRENKDLDDRLLRYTRLNKSPTELRQKEEQDPEKKAHRIESIQKEKNKKTIEKMNRGIGLIETEFISEEAAALAESKYRAAVNIRDLFINTR